MTGTGEKRAWAWFLGWLALAVALFSVGLCSGEWACEEAEVYEGICRELAGNTTDGRQALVSSIWWSPLAVVLRLPFSAVLGDTGYPVASLIVSALAGSATIIVVGRAASCWKVGWPSMLMVAATALNPFFLSECFNGSPATTAVCLVAATAWFLAQWTGTGEVKWLMYLGFGCAGLACAEFGAALWLGAVVAVLALDQVARRGEWSKKEATLILALLPALYVAALWVLMNWLIMGDAVYFLRSLAGILSGRNQMRFVEAMPCEPEWTAVALAFAAMLVSFAFGLRAGTYLGVVSCAAVAVALWLIARGFAWSAGPLLIAAGPLCALNVGFLAGGRGRARMLFQAACVLPVGVSALAMQRFAERGGMRGRAACYARLARERGAVLPGIERRVLETSLYPKVFACGYDAFSLIGRRRSEVFEYCVDLDFTLITRGYRGHTLYVLIRRPSGRSALESVHWKYDRIFELGGPATLYAGDWGDWRLFEIIDVRRR